MIGSALSFHAARKAADSVASIGAPGALSIVLHEAQRIDLFSAANGSRLF